MSEFLSPAPEVRLTNALLRPYENAVATARTCYSAKGIVTTAEVGGDELTDPAERAKRAALRDRLAEALYRAGHHTTLQHAHFQFALSNVSRQFIWSFLHSHPWYNSEQVSQRYVAVRPENFAVPPLAGEALAVYTAAVRGATADYQQLNELLAPLTAREYLARFPARKQEPPRLAGEVQKRTQEAARYCLPVAIFACLYHTVSLLTLLRYVRLAALPDCPHETRLVVGRMRAAAVDHDPLLARLFAAAPTLATEETLEGRLLAGPLGAADAASRAAFRAEFDRRLAPHRFSRLADATAAAGNERLLARAVREVLGLPAARLADDRALALLADPRENPYLGEALNLGAHSPLLRAGFLAHYQFQKRISHTADSQDQRHRTTPAARPLLAAQLGTEPDFVTPALISAEPAAEQLYRESLARSWAAAERLKALGVADEFRLYVLPNALAVRFTETADFLALAHKLTKRLCYNAQEEIWRISLEERAELARVSPRLAEFVLPPCAIRARAGIRPPCPEGARYCGVPVWTLAPAEYRRII